MGKSPLLPGELALISSTFLFQSQEKSVILEALARDRCTVEEIAKGRDIYTPTQFRRSLAILLAGTARVSKGGLAVSVLGPGELFGAAALFTDQREYESTVTAREGCRVLFLPEALVGELLARSPAAAARYIRYLSQRIQFLSRKLDGLLLSGAGSKLRRYLLEEGDVTCPAVELARRLDVSRASLYRALGELEALGAIEKRGKRVTVLSREKLTSLEVT